MFNQHNTAKEYLYLERIEREKENDLFNLGGDFPILPFFFSI